MSQVNIRRAHTLGIEQAREVAAQWMREAQEKFGMSCESAPGEAGDTLRFSRSGAQGQLVVAADHFELNMTLGFLMSGFAPVIQAQIEKNLDQLLAGRGQPASRSPSA